MTQRKRSLALLSLLAMLLLVGSGSVAAGAEKIWVAEFTFDVPDGTWTEGVHTYWYEVSWTEPESGGYPYLGEYEFEISADAPLYRDFALIRFGFGIVRIPPPATHCERLDPEVLHPDQATRFHLGWPADWEMTYPEAKAHFESMTITVHWDGDGSAQLVRHEIFAQQPETAFNRMWPNSLCNWTVRPSSD